MRADKKGKPSSSKNLNALKLNLEESNKNSNNVNVKRQPTLPSNRVTDSSPSTKKRKQR